MCVFYFLDFVSQRKVLHKLTTNQIYIFIYTSLYGFYSFALFRRYESLGMVIQEISKKSCKLRNIFKSIAPNFFRSLTTNILKILFNTGYVFLND